MNDRKFDVVLYGATGFTGRQAVRYFQEHAPAGLSWAIAGRDQTKLASLGAKVPVLVAAANDQSAIDRVVSQARITLSTAGPFSLYSDRIVDPACDFGPTMWTSRARCSGCAL